MGLSHGGGGGGSELSNLSSWGHHSDGKGATLTTMSPPGDPAFKHHPVGAQVSTHKFWEDTDGA